MFSILSCLLPTVEKNDDGLPSTSQDRDSFVSAPSKKKLATGAFMNPASSAPPSPQPTVETLDIIYEDEVLESTSLFPSHHLVPDVQRKRAKVRATKTQRKFSSKSSKDALKRARLIAKLAPAQRYSKQWRIKQNVKILPPVTNHNDELEKLASGGDINALRQECDRCRRVFGRKNPRVGQVLLFIGTKEASQGNHLAAMKLLRKAGKCTSGKNWRVEADFIKAESNRRIGLVTLEMGGTVSAEDYLTDALAMHRQNETNNGRNPNVSLHVAHCLNDLGMLRGSHGKCESALLSFKRAARIYDRFVDTDPLQLASVLESIGSAHFELGNLKRAKMYHKDAFTIKASVVGKNHLSLVSSYTSLGGVYVANEKYKSAASCYAHAETILTRECQCRGSDNQVTGLVSQLVEMKDLLATAVALREGIVDASHIVWVCSGKPEPSTQDREGNVPVGALELSSCMRQRRDNRVN
jgi:tetratricopeptide (TPR) repeat protein